MTEPSEEEIRRAQMQALTEKVEQYELEAETEHRVYSKSPKDSYSQVERQAYRQLGNLLFAWRLRKAAIAQRDAKIQKLQQRLHYWVETMEAFVSDGLISKWDNYDREIQSDRDLLTGWSENHDG